MISKRDNHWTIIFWDDYYLGELTHLHQVKVYKDRYEFQTIYEKEVEKPITFWGKIVRTLRGGWDERPKKETLCSRQTTLIVPREKVKFIQYVKTSDQK